MRLADLRARRRAMEDLYAALQAVKNVHSALVSTLRIRSVMRYTVFNILCVDSLEYNTPQLSISERDYLVIHMVEAL